MRNRILLLKRLLVCWAFIGTSHTLIGQVNSSQVFCREYQDLLAFMKFFHVERESLTSEELQELMLRTTDALDPQGLIWLAEDTLVFQGFLPLIEQVQRGGNCGFLEELVTLYEYRLKEARALLESLPSPAYTYIDTLRLYGPDKKNQWAADATKLKNRWNKYLKYQILNRAYQDTDSTDVIQTDSLAKYAETYEGIACQKGLCKIQNILQYPEGLTTYVSEVMFKEMIQLYDPHSAYFPPTDKRNFEKALSKDSYTFGFELGRNRQGQVEIARLVPGGAAWKSQEINKGDLVTEVRFASGQVLDLICASLSDLTSEIEATDSRKLTLEIQKAGGLKKTVTLIKEKMSVEDNTLDSFILKGEKKVGYIYLPGFYTQFEDGNALGCANDVAKELLMLQIEGIEGLILDLRFNGGGSMEEAIDLAGLFIDEGPIAMTNTKEGKVKAIRDMNRGVTYEGPLMVLVNGLSASASELFAASIQDYHRGLIVGTTTYGKATGQIIVPLHPSRPQEGASVKVTNFKFYRVTGDSHQAQGVVPDLEIPDPWRELVTLEVDQPSVIARDQVQKELVYDALPPISVGPLKSKSQVRIAANPYFQVQGEAMKEVQKVMDQGEHLILHPGGYGETLGRLSEIFDAVYDPEVGEQAVFVVDNNRSMATVLMLSENLKLRNDQVKEKLLTDIQLQEAFQVMIDWLQSP